MSTFFFVAHWWHPVIYEAQMIGGNDAEQETAIQATEVNLAEVLEARPQRMLLTRELMPRYAELSPESGNIFDALQILNARARLYLRDTRAVTHRSLRRKRVGDAAWSLISP
jgi:hypothetical protein